METPNRRYEKHHFLPRFYLQGFTPCGTRKGKVYIHTFHNMESALRHPKEIAWKPNMNSWEDNSKTINDIEVELGKLDAKFSNVVRAVIKSNSLSFLDSDNYKDLILFLATMVARNPRQRWIYNMASLDDGQPPPTQEEQLSAMVTLIPDMFKELLQRKWKLRVIPNELSTLILPSSPFAVFWTIDPIPNRSPDICVPNTTLYFPLAKSHLLEGSYENTFQPEINTRLHLAAVNTHLLLHGPEFVISTFRDPEVYFAQRNVYMDIPNFLTAAKYGLKTGQINVDDIQDPKNMSPIRIADYLLTKKST